jgi:hypothetical protein
MGSQSHGDGGGSGGGGGQDKGAGVDSGHRGSDGRIAQEGRGVDGVGDGGGGLHDRLDDGGIEDGGSVGQGEGSGDGKGVGEKELGISLCLSLVEASYGLIAVSGQGAGIARGVVGPIVGGVGVAPGGVQGVRWVGFRRCQAKRGNSENSGLQKKFICHIIYD